MIQATDVDNSRDFTLQHSACDNANYVPIMCSTTSDSAPSLCTDSLTTHSAPCGSVCLLVCPHVLYRQRHEFTVDFVTAYCDRDN